MKLGFKDFEEWFGGWDAFQRQGGIKSRDPQAPRVIRAIYQGRKPAGYVNALTTPVLTRVIGLRLLADTISQAGGSDLITVIARHGRTEELMKQASDVFYGYPFSDQFHSLVAKISNKTIFGATTYLLRDPDHVHPAAKDICLGLLFGYPTCCIRYFVGVVYLGDSPDPKKDLDDKYQQWVSPGRALCRRCREQWHEAIDGLEEIVEKKLRAILFQMKV